MNPLDSGFACSLCGERLPSASSSAHTCSPGKCVVGRLNDEPTTTPEKVVWLLKRNMLLERLLSALDRCLGHHGAFSRHDPHDLSCEWWNSTSSKCTCGRAELDAAAKEAREAREA